MALFTKGQTGNAAGRAGKALTDDELSAMCRTRSSAILKNLLRIAEGKVPDTPSATMVRAGELCLDRGFGKTVSGDKSSIAPPQDEGKAVLKDAHEQLAELLEKTVGGLVPCPQCRYLVMEWSQACPHCGLKASEVTEEHMIRLREGRSGDDWQLDIFTWGMATANARGAQRAIADASSDS